MYVSVQPSAVDCQIGVEPNPDTVHAALLLVEGTWPQANARVTLTRDQWARVVAQLAAAGITAEASEEVPC